MAIARRIEAGEIGPLCGLDAAGWARLAGLLSLATPAPHARLAAQPLTLLPPNRVRLLNPVQALQTLLTLLFTGGAYGRRLADLAALMPNPSARRRLALFMSTLLARRLTVGWSAERDRVRVTLEDAWSHPVVRRRWEALAEVLTRADCERVVRLATQRGVASACLRWLDDTVATEGWALDCQGQADAPALTD